jgi:tellurite resistance protein
MSQSLRFLPVSLFGAVMGLAGLALACRKAEATLGLSPLLAHAWIALATLALAALLVVYLGKLVRHPAAVREEFTNPALLGYCATLPIGMTLVAGGLQPHAEALAQVLWWAGVALLCAFQLWTVARLLPGGVSLAQVNGGWMIMLVGGIVVPSSGLALGHPDTSAYLFGVSATLAPLVTGLVLYRMVFGPELPPAARPTWFIVLVPPALVYLNGEALSGAPAGIGLQGVFYASLPLTVALVIAARGCWRWPFGASWWAFTFPLDAVAAAAVQYAHDHPHGPWRAIAAAGMLLATAAALLVLARTLAALSRGTLLVPPPAPRG